MTVDNFDELELELEKDSSGEYRKEIIDYLINQQMILEQALDGGLAPNDFDDATKVKNSISGAMHIIRRLWEQHHAVRSGRSEAVNEF